MAVRRPVRGSRLDSNRPTVRNAPGLLETDKGAVEKGGQDLHDLLYNIKDPVK